MFKTPKTAKSSKYIKKYKKNQRQGVQKKMFIDTLFENNINIVAAEEFVSSGM